MCSQIDVSRIFNAKFSILKGEEKCETFVDHKCHLLLQWHGDIRGLYVPSS